VVDPGFCCERGRSLTRCRGAFGVEIEMMKVRGVENAVDSGVWGSVISFPVESVVEPQPTMILVFSKADRMSLICTCGCEIFQLFILYDMVQNDNNLK